MIERWRGWNAALVGKEVRMKACFQCLLSFGLSFALWMSSQAATYNGVSYSTDGDIVAGRWTSQFAKAKTYAYNNHVPLLVVWVNPGCGYCRNFEANVLSSASFSAWLKKRGYIGVFAVNTVTSEADAVSAFIGSVRQFPLCAVYWNPVSGSAVKYSFTGRSMSALTYENTVDAKVGDYAGVTKKTYALKLTASPTEGGTLSGGGTYEVDKKVTLKATASPGYDFVGWYSGSTKLSSSMSYSYTTGAKAVTLAGKFAAKSYSLSISADANAGKVSGAGVYVVNKKVTLRATPLKGYVFLGWYDGTERLSESKSYTYVMSAKDKKLTAKFTTVATDAAAVTAMLNNVAFSAKKTSFATNVMCGVSVSWPVASAGLTTTTVAVSGLPTGLKFSAKTGLITGVPSRAQQKAVNLVIKTTGGTKVAYVMNVTVQALPVWAYGTYNGGGSDGLLTMTIGSTGKISGKYSAHGTNWTLTAASYSKFDSKKDVFSADVVVKYGKIVQTNQVTVTGSAESLLGSVTCQRFTGWWNGWKNAALKNAAKDIDRATNVTYDVSSPVPGKITLSFGSSGAVTAKGQFIVGKNARTGKDIVHTASCSSVLCRTDDDGSMFVYVYFQYKKSVFSGYFDCVEVGFDGMNIFF